MKGKIQKSTVLLIFIISASFFLKLFIILKYNNDLILSSDDLNYIKSAVYYLKSGLFTYYNFDEPTVFIMPFYPLFLAGVFKIFGSGAEGMTVFRLIQAVVSCLGIWFIYLLAAKLFNKGTGLLAAVMTAFYFPAVIAVGYALTETIFTSLLILLVYLSIVFSEKPSVLKFSILGTVWALAVLCRPTIALYPVLLFLYLVLFRRPGFGTLLKMGIPMALVFTIVMMPWWVRNYREYAAFIPLSASTGNPMLQGTYVDYEQTPENTTYYKLGKTVYETNQNEVKVAWERIRSEFEKDFWGYLEWYTLGKTSYFWKTVFYWRHFLGVSQNFVMAQHYIILFGFVGIFILLRRGFSKYLLPVLTVVYFNGVHCLYMAFDRYAFPLLPLLSVFSAFLIHRIYLYVKGTSAAEAYLR